MKTSFKALEIFGALKFCKLSNEDINRIIALLDASVRPFHTKTSWQQGGFWASRFVESYLGCCICWDGTIEPYKFAKSEDLISDEEAMIILSLLEQEVFLGGTKAKLNAEAKKYEKVAPLWKKLHTKPYDADNRSCLYWRLYTYGMSKHLIAKQEFNLRADEGVISDLFEEIARRNFSNDDKLYLLSLCEQELTERKEFEAYLKSEDERLLKELQQREERDRKIEERVGSLAHTVHDLEERPVGVPRESRDERRKREELEEFRKERADQVYSDLQYARYMGYGMLQRDALIQRRSLEARERAIHNRYKR